LLAAAGIFLSGMVTTPLKRIPHEETVALPAVSRFGIGRFMPQRVRRQTATVIESIGGAGTFDGIVLSGLAATMLAYPPPRHRMDGVFTPGRLHVKQIAA
jgi:uncharacterized membrane protein